MSIIKLSEVQPDHVAFPYVCGDTETTGVGSDAEVIEITMTEFDRMGNIGSTISYMCEPICGFIPEGASKVNGIYMEDVRGYPSYLKGGVREDCAEFLGQRQFAAHNASFDIRMMKIKPASVKCTLEMARKKWPGGRNNLKAACNKAKLGWSDEDAHRATYDVQKCIELLVWLWWPNGVPTDDPTQEDFLA